MFDMKVFNNIYRMGKIKKWSVLLLLTIGLGWSSQSCDFLDVDPIGQTSIPVFFSDMEGIRSALPGAYSGVYKYYDSQFLRYPELAGNMVHLNIVGGNADMIDQYNFTSDPESETGAVGYIWRYIYEAMANINNIIQYQPDLLQAFPKHQQELEQIMGEALFLRALAHFDLVRVYAQPYNYTSDASHPGIPVLLKTPGADDNVGRSSVAFVFQQIVADLERSIELLKDKNVHNPYHASVWAAYGLRARAALYMEDWENAIRYAGLLIDELPLSTGENYLAMFNGMIPGDEMIFRVNGLEKSSSLSSFYSPTSPAAIPADTLLALFDDPNDIRLQLLQNEDGAPACRKYFITANVSDLDKHYDPIVLRLSEMYLIRAEAYANTNRGSEAVGDLKAIMARASGLSPDDLNVSEDEATLLIMIDKERARELAFEGHRFYDIIRRKQSLIRPVKTNSTVQEISYPSDLFVLPIPQKELDTNTNIVPNPTVN